MMKSDNFLTTTKTEVASKQRVFVVVVVAAGSGSRLGYGIPKALAPVAGKELLRWALGGVQAAGVASRIIVTVPPKDSALTHIAEEYGALAVEGGSTRAESVVAALQVIDRAPVQPGMSEVEPDAVLVHDCARCFTPTHVFSNVADALVRGEHAVIPVVSVVDTVKTIDATDYVKGTPSRADLRAVQTPQGFDLGTLLAAYEKAADQGLTESITDDAMLAEMMNIPVLCVEGAAESFKITTPLDMALAHALLEKGWNK